MPAFKYTTNEQFNPFLQAANVPRLGRNYTFHGRLYCQMKKDGAISYADMKYDIDLRLVGWTSISQDLDIKVKNIEISQEFGMKYSECKNIVDKIESLRDITISCRIANTGNVIRVFNVDDLEQHWLPEIKREQHAIDSIHANPLLSAFVSGFIAEGVRASKVTTSTMFPSVEIVSELKATTTEMKSHKATETHISDKRVFVETAKIEQVAFEKHAMSLQKGESYNYTTMMTTQRGFERMLPYSIAFSAEESFGNNMNIFISAGFEKIVTDVEVPLWDRTYNLFKKRISAMF